MEKRDLRSMLENLTGQKIPVERDNNNEILGLYANALTEGKSIGYSQFNELLLNLGYDRVCAEFFSFISKKDEEPKDSIKSEKDLKEGIEKFRKLSLFYFGNTKYGFKTLSNDPEKLKEYIKELFTSREELFVNRHDPLVGMRKISGEDTYLLGYLSARELEKKIKDNPDDRATLDLNKKREKIICDGIHNNNVYLTSDHLDVYIATSMRERHEYFLVSKFISELEKTNELKKLRLKIFDPTQAYCKNRIDKGLTEALMLKRAFCTVYLAQETDTFGKDSELASTLAQGKPVIAFVPQLNETLDDSIWDEYVFGPFKSTYLGESECEILMRILRIYNPDLAWESEKLREFLKDKTCNNKKIEYLKNEAKKAVINRYNKRAEALIDNHPLGLQVNLDTGVANGVLVVRTIQKCAELIKNILLNTLEFEIDDNQKQEMGNISLKEKISGCVYRSMTTDKLLTNSFWNFYEI